MSRVAIPIDSIVVVPGAGVWSEEFALVIARHLATSGKLRVVPAALARGWAAVGEHSPEEIARHFNARCVVRCDVAIRGGDLNVRVEVIDALAETLMCETSYLVSVSEAVSVQAEIVRWIGSCCFAAIPQMAGEAGDWYVPAVQAKVLRRDGRDADAVALIRDVALRNREALPAFAEIVVDAPSRVLDAETIALARLAVPEADDLVAARVVSRFVRNWSEADVAFMRAASRNGDPAPHAHYGLFLAALRRFDEAERELRMANELSDAMMPERALVERGLAYCGRGGSPQISRDDSYGEAMEHASCGATAEAFQALRDAISSYSPYVIFTAVEPAFMPLRQEAAFVELVRELGLR